MENIRIGRRLLLGFGAVVMLTIVLGLFALQRYSTQQSLSERIENRDYTALQSILALNHGEDQMRGSRQLALLSGFLRRDHMQAEAPEALERRWYSVRDQNIRMLAELDASVATWEAQAFTAQRAAGWRRVRSAVADTQKALLAITPEAEAMFSALNSGNLTEAVARTADVERFASQYEGRLADAARAIQENIQVGRAEVAAAAADTRNSVILVLVLTFAVSVVLAYLITRSIVVPLRDFAAVVERIGGGDLREQVRMARRDEIGDLGASLDRMVAGLKNVAANTRSVAENLNTATAEILASTQQQAASTAEQAAAVQEANATMAEISQSGAQISDRAKQVATAAEAASSASAVGMQSVRSTVQIMESIREQAEVVAENVVALSEKTQAVGDIINSVNEVSEQSHLLAVNAAIQAAVAGEHGRSFTVVANEMKNLAAQSKQATLQVRTILGDIQKGITSSVMLTEEAVKRIESGRQQASVAERTIHDLTENIEESIRAFQQIVGGSSQQQIGFEQVTQAFRNVGIASQETASSTKQLEKAAANLNQLSMQLREAVERYKV